jgi:DUF971 family protein
MEGIAVQPVTIKTITDDELICEYDDKQEVHIATEYLRAWWPDVRKRVDPEVLKRRAAKAKATKAAR